MGDTGNADRVCVCGTPVVFADVPLAAAPLDRIEAKRLDNFQPTTFARQPFEESTRDDPLATWVIDRDTERAYCLLPHRARAQWAPVYAAHKARCTAAREEAVPHDCDL